MDVNKGCKSVGSAPTFLAVNMANTQNLTFYGELSSASDYFVLAGFSVLASQHN